MPRPATGQVIVKDTQRGQVFALRFVAYGQRRYVTLGTADDGWTRAKADDELIVTMAKVRRGEWQPPVAAAEPPAVDVDQDPSFHVFASEWLASKVLEVAERTADRYRSELVNHLLPFFHAHQLSQITVSEVDRYRRHKVREGAISPTTINQTLMLLAAIIETAVEYGHIDRNPAKGRRRRLKVTRKAPVHLDSAEHIAVLLEAAEAVDRAPLTRGVGRRPLIATLELAGLRAGEACQLRWRSVDLANGRVVIGDRVKSFAGYREIDLVPLLRDELLAWKAIGAPAMDDLVFPTARGTPRDKDNINRRVMGPVTAKATELLAQRDAHPLPRGLTPHKLRHTFASMLTALGRDPAYVMAQLGHTDPAFTLRVYAHMMRRSDVERARLRALVEGADWALLGTNGHQDADESAAPIPERSDPGP